MDDLQPSPNDLSTGVVDGSMDAVHRLNGDGHA